ncbi:MAG: NTP transferase domain-containing protein [Syntrophobacteraceae bacterium]|jgi:NDP-sugar pyrophosphorylase family protein
MKAGIIAAGLGERMAKGGITTPKPLIPVAGHPLISRVIHTAAKLRASSVACIVNAENPAVVRYLEESSWPLPLEIIVRTTPNSMESLFSLAPLLSDEPFILFTVDVVTGDQTVERFLDRARGLGDGQGALALTDFIDDEKPLWVSVDGGSRIVAIGGAARGSRYVTAGFYYFSPEIFAMVDAARAKHLSALRQFLGFLIDHGYPLHGIPVSKTLDVDFPGDIRKAEALLMEIGEI